MAHANNAVCDTHQVNGGDQAFLMNLNTPLEFGGTVYDGNIYVSPKGTMTFGQGDYTFWDYPQTPSISIASWDYHAFATGTHPWAAQNDLYVRYGSTETSICVDWKVLPWGQSSGNPVYIRLIAEVNPVNYTWTPTYQVSNTAPAGARYGVRYTQGGEVLPLTIQTITTPPEPAPVVPPAPEPTPEPSPEPTPTPEPTPEPSPQPTPEPTPEPSPSPEPTPTPVEPEPTPTPEPSPVVPVVPEPQPSTPAVPEPEPSQEPSPEPTPSPEPQEPELPEEPTIEPVEPSPESVEPEPLPEPSPEPSPSTEESITSAEELPEEISPEVLMAIDFDEIVPTELSEAQAEALIEAALETFETAEQGSEEYVQALEALFVAAQQDDIVLDEALAAIPLLGDVLGGATELVNFLGNAGADMSPQVREDSEKVVVTAIVAVQAALSAISISGIATTINIRSGA